LLTLKLDCTAKTRGHDTELGRALDHAESVAIFFVLSDGSLAFLAGAETGRDVMSSMLGTVANELPQITADVHAPNQPNGMSYASYSN